MKKRHSFTIIQRRIPNAEADVKLASGLSFPTQLLLLPKLKKEEYIWLSRFRENLDWTDVECLAQAYHGKNQNPLYEAAMDIIVRANQNLYKEEKEMCEALRELFADELEQREEIGLKKGQTEGRLNELYSLVKDGLLNLDIAAKRAGMSVETFQRNMQCL